MANETRSQGFELYVVDDITVPMTPALVKIGNITDLGEFGATLDELDTTNLDSKAKEFVMGLPDNGEMSVQINVKSGTSEHKLLWKCSKLSPDAGDSRKKWIVCASNGTEAPALTGGDITPPTDRDWWAFSASVKSFRFPVAVNTVVKATVALRISGEIESSYDD